MTTLREHASAWFLVALLSASLVAVWGRAMPMPDDGRASLACLDHAAADASVDLPRGATWSPDPALTGLPVGAGTAAYDLAEERSLQRHHGTVAIPPELLAGHDSSTSPNPIGMC